MSTETEVVQFVDENGTPTGEVGPKLASHTANTRLHLAFSSYIFNDKGEFLATQRALSKRVWPSVWTNSCCGHVAPGETMIDAIVRRLNYELGMTAADFQVLLPTYRYTTTPYNGIIENEFCPVYIGRASSQPQPNPEEVEDLKWMPWQEYVDALESDKADIWSWWGKDQLKQLKDHPLIQEYSKPKN
jgi:isopentenyl-diphosphate delta-isomerase